MVDTLKIDGNAVADKGPGIYGYFQAKYLRKTQRLAGNRPGTDSTSRRGAAPGG